MKLTRIFHPIGQGAFYTEHHQVDGKDFTIVYDCGSTTLDREKRELKIKSAFPKGWEIDILFISHCHADHINGIDILKERYKIKTVVMPFINDEAKILLKVNNFINDGYTDTQLIDNPSDYFGEGTRVILIEINPLEGGEDGTNLGNPINISTAQGGNYPSGTVFSSGLSNYEWLFIPFNYQHLERKKEFIEGLKKYNLTIKDINSIEKITQHKDKIKKAYSEVEGDLNENSMMLFSGEIKWETTLLMASIIEDILIRSDHFGDYHYHYYHLRLSASCIYFGDIDLNSPGITNDIHKRLTKLLPIVGTIQVPHHGSVHNFDPAFFSPNTLEGRMVAIFSFGTTNKYGHPSAKIISDVFPIARPILVTEELNSIAIQVLR